MSLMGDPAKIEVAVCVHNALPHVQACLSSVQSGNDCRVLLSDDGSDRPTAQWLSAWAEQQDATLLRSNKALGYTKAANAALRASRADIVVLLNSDAVVPRGWLDRLVEVFQSDAHVGLVGPLSNAASWQSVPVRFGGATQWNDGGWMLAQDLGRVDGLVQEFSDRDFPQVPLLNGFCLAISRAVIDQVGLLDEASFPRGYGEENDYCLRVAQSGFQARIADHLFVYHAKSRSYGMRRRAWLRWRAGRALNRKHGADVVLRSTQTLKNDPILSAMRASMGQALALPSD